MLPHSVYSVIEVLAGWIDRVVNRGGWRVLLQLYSLVDPLFVERVHTWSVRHLGRRFFGGSRGLGVLRLAIRNVDSRTEPASGRVG